MPVMDGYDATMKIREFLHKMKVRQPIISAVTGHSEKQYTMKAINAGMNQVLSKPINHERLKCLLRKLDM